MGFWRSSPQLNTIWHDRVKQSIVHHCRRHSVQHRKYCCSQSKASTTPLLAEVGHMRRRSFFWYPGFVLSCHPVLFLAGLFIQSFSISLDAIHWYFIRATDDVIRPQSYRIYPSLYVLGRRYIKNQSYVSSLIKCI